MLFRSFSAAVGAPILAAAGGVVITAEYHPSYGNMVEIDHGNELITRYAHASRLHVKIGDMVLRGTRIADIGSTGRSTGAHLHFEVHQRGVAVNPAQFLQLPAITALTRSRGERAARKRCAVSCMIRKLALRTTAETSSSFDLK